MSSNNNYISLDELQRICESLGLPTDGTRRELIDNIVNNNNTTSPVSRVCFTRSSVVPFPGQSISESETTTPDTEEMVDQSVPFFNNFRFNAFIRVFGVLVFWFVSLVDVIPLVNCLMKWKMFIFQSNIPGLINFSEIEVKRKNLKTQSNAHWKFE